jgi:hypothetical protein
MFGECSEGQFDDSLGTWRCSKSKGESQKWSESKEVRGGKVGHKQAQAQA